MLGFKGDIEYLYNISPVVVSTMQFFQTIVILIDFEMKQASNWHQLCCWPARMSNWHLVKDNIPNYVV